ncbi:uncharacterized protein LOC133186005 [Saccostrea echinata]|uniref:uncharacterized protein LOC133186005 n=1 Tax=Saccostrea echinata TaxID=191078 RepID=UPI002A7EFB62|nr:uncharacterized protein LOC133186005 [Saccostrea echinata]
MVPTKHLSNVDDALWGLSTLERTRRLGQQTYQRALKNHAAWTEQREQGQTMYPIYKERGACPICGKSVEPNIELESAFSDVMMMMSHMSQICQRYYCATDGEPQTKHDKKHCRRYHGTQLINKMNSRKVNSLNKEVHLLESEQPTSVDTCHRERSKSCRHATFDISASLPQSRKAKHVRFSPGETVEVHFCA